ncbi:MAG: hypothetical protein U0441_06755 [Polyangiaceae bacterium]
MRTSMMLASALLALGTFAAWFSGCSPSAESACQSFDTTLCDQLEACSPFGFQVSYGTKEVCETRLKDRCMGAIELTGAVVTPTDVQSCSDDYAELTCDELLAGKKPSTCDVPGTKDDGAACAADVQCKNGMCRSNGEGKCGVCTTPVVEGGGCDNTNKFCGSGLYCNADGTCHKPGPSGATCDAKNPCASTLWCDSGKCAKPAAAEGADCTGKDFTSCDGQQGLFCSPTTSKCVKAGVAKLGEVCGFDLAANTITGCEADTYCETDAMGKGTCVAKLAVGSSCTIDAATGSSKCVSSAVCINGTCSLDYPVCN